MRVFEGADKAGRMSAFYIPVSVFLTVICSVLYYEYERTYFLVFYIFQESTDSDWVLF